MMINNNRKRNFNELSDWYNPLTWFGQPSVPPPAFDGISQDEQSAAPGPNFWKKSTDNSFDSAIKSNFVAPFKDAEKGAVKIEDNIINVAKSIENDISTLKDGVISGFDTVGSTFETFGKNVENVFINDVEPIGKDLYKVASSILKGTVYLIERPMQVALIGGGYLILRYFNEYKQAIA